MTELQTTKDVIKALGDTPGVSQLTGALPKAISAWRTAGRFPWKTYPAITAELAKLGMSAPESLWGMQSKAPTRETAA